MVGRNDPCWCGSGKKWKKCHYPEQGETLPSTNEIYRLLKRHDVILKTPEQIEGIRKACLLTSDILVATSAKAKEGVTTRELNDFAHQMHLDAGAIPAPLHYGHPPCPFSICTSLNEVICHGFPDDVPLKQGDILNIDVSAILNGFYGDCSRMVVIGETDPESQNVVDTSYECLMKAIDILKPGLPLYKIGETISYHAEKKGCSVVDQFVGHGVGLDFHEGPQVPHHRNKLNLPLVPGMTFTIEPMINAGVKDGTLDLNEWTARTRDRKPSAQWEHTILMTEDGYEVLTTWKR
jgi:methionyl aminopeptidase